MKEIIKGVDWRRFRDMSLLDRVPLLYPAASVLLENGFSEGNYVRAWLCSPHLVLALTPTQ